MIPLLYFMVPFHSKSLKIRHRLSRWSSRFESDNCHSGGTKLYSVHIGNHNKFILPRQNKIKTGISHKEKSMYIDYSFLLLRERRKGENSLKGLAITFFTNKGEFCIFYQCKNPTVKYLIVQWCTPYTQVVFIILCLF